MMCSDSVQEFIERYNISATLYRFSDTVESVEKASHMCGTDPSNIIKTLVLIADSLPVIAIVPGNKKLSYRKLANVVKARSLRMAKPHEVKMYTGFDVGGVSPLTECIKSYMIVVDQDVAGKEYVWCGGGDLYSLALVKVRDILAILNPVIADISDPPNN
ncbi:MAG: YbaK/EbsC family protein [Ignisphaera sp.]